MSERILDMSIVFGLPSYDLCQALLNQRVYCGGDPVGHACLAPATNEIIYHGHRITLCGRCYDWIVKELCPIDGWEKTRA